MKSTNAVCLLMLMSMVCSVAKPEVMTSSEMPMKSQNIHLEANETSSIPIFIKLSTSTTTPTKMANNRSSYETITCNCPHNLPSTQSVVLTIPQSAFRKMRQLKKDKLVQLAGLMFLFPVEHIDTVIEQLMETNGNTETTNLWIKNKFKRENNVEEMASAFRDQLQNVLQIKSSVNVTPSDDDYVNRKQEPTASTPYYSVNFPNLYGPNRLIPQDVSEEDVESGIQLSHVKSRSAKLPLDLICKPASGVKFNPSLIGQTGSCTIKFDPKINYDDLDTVHNLTISLEAPKSRSYEEKSNISPANPPDVSQRFNKQLIKPVEIIKNDVTPSDPPFYKYGESYGYNYDPEIGGNRAVDSRQAPEVKCHHPEHTKLHQRNLDPILVNDQAISGSEDEEKPPKDKVNIWGYWNQFIFPRKGSSALNENSLPFDTGVVQPTEEINYEKRFVEEQKMMTNDRGTSRVPEVVPEEPFGPVTDPADVSGQSKVGGCGCLGWECPKCQINADDRRKENLWWEMLQNMYSYYWPQQYYAPPLQYFSPPPNDSVNTSADAETQTAL